MKKNVYSLVLSEDVIAAVDRLAYQHSTNRSNMINEILAEYVSYVTPEKRMQQILKQVESLLNGQDTFQVMLGNSSDTMLSLRSALAYKYNPTVRYSVELYRNGPVNGSASGAANGSAKDSVRGSAKLTGAAGDPAVGVLKVSLRTQNANLIVTMQRFYDLWIRLEQHYLGAGSAGGSKGAGNIAGTGGGRSYTIEGGRMTRELRPARAASTGADVAGANSTRGAGSAGYTMTEQTLGQAIARYVQVLDQCMKVYFYNLENPNGALREMEAQYVAYLQSGEII